MPNHPFKPIDGRIEIVTIDSPALSGNLLGDPNRREVPIYLPPDYDESGKDYFLFVDLVGYTGSGFSHLGWKPFAETVPQRVERLVSDGKMDSVVIAFPDCFTSLGGNQYINSIVTGRWADFLIEEMIPALEREFRIRKGKENRAVFGKSSGGYGSLIHGLKYADAWHALACHSGDIGFNLVIRTDFPIVLNRLADFDRDIGTFFDHIESCNKIKNEDMHVMMILAMAAFYDPDPRAPKGIALPVDLMTCKLDPERWRAWLEHDPLTLIQNEDCRANLKKLAGIYIDCGSKDQYHLHYGAREFSAELKQVGIEHHYEEFDDNHSSIDYRMDLSLPFLFEALSGKT